MQFLILRGIPLKQKESLVYVDEKRNINIYEMPSLLSTVREAFFIYEVFN
jgi:hypothetical protein